MSKRPLFAGVMGWPAAHSRSPLLHNYWLKAHQIAGAVDAQAVRARAVELGGHAAAFRGGDRAAGVFQPLAAPLAAVHRRLKQAFDPAGIFNPGRLYPEF